MNQTGEGIRVISHYREMPFPLSVFIGGRR